MSTIFSLPPDAPLPRLSALEVSPSLPGSSDCLSSTEPVIVEFTRDSALLNQYFRIYERECRVVDQAEFRAAEAKHNQEAHILIARMGERCIGGGRLSVRCAAQSRPLPVETDGFRLADHFPELQSADARYGEFTRLALLPEFRDGTVALEMWRSFYSKFLALELDVSFAVAPLTNLRAYRRYCRQIGVKEAVIHTGIALPPYPGFEGIRDHLLSIVAEEVIISRRLGGGAASATNRTIGSRT